MTKAKANWHAIVAIFVVIGAEFGGLKDETSAQLASHTWVFWLCLFCAIIVGAGNSLISTKTEDGSANPPETPSPDSPVDPTKPK